MTDTTTRKPLHVRNVGSAGPYVLVPLDQLDELSELLRTHGIPFWSEETAVSLDDKPYVVGVNFGRDADAKAIQELLDSVP